MPKDRPFSGGFGERRIGTNYVARLISDNLEIKETTKYGNSYPDDAYCAVHCGCRAPAVGVILSSFAQSPIC
jgi:hypothetical protein